MLAEVVDNSQFAAGGGMAATAQAELHRHAVDLARVAGWQAGCGDDEKLLLVDQQHRHQHFRIELLQAPHHVTEGVLQRPLGEHAVQHRIARFLQCLALALLMNVTQAAVQALPVLLTGSQAQGNPAGMAIAFQQAYLTEPTATLARKNRRNILTKRFAMITGNEVQQRTSQALVDAVAGNALPGRVEEADAPAVVGEENRLVQLLDQFAVARLAGLQLVMGLLLLAKVDVDAIQLQLVARIAQQQVAGKDVHRAAIPVLQSQFAGRDSRATDHPHVDIADHLGTHGWWNDQLLQASAHGVGHFVAVELGAGLVPENHPAFAVVTLDGDARSLLEQLAEALLTFP